MPHAPELVVHCQALVELTSFLLSIRLACLLLIYFFEKLFSKSLFCAELEDFLDDLEQNKLLLFTGIAFSFKSILSLLPNDDNFDYLLNI